ncbi:unnamed protein product, partial [Rotaria sp. Silwood1]
TVLKGFNLNIISIELICLLLARPRNTQVNDVPESYTDNKLI